LVPLRGLTQEGEGEGTRVGAASPWPTNKQVATLKSRVKSYVYIPDGWMTGQMDDETNG